MIELLASTIRLRGTKRQPIFALEPVSASAVLRCALSCELDESFRPQAMWPGGHPRPQAEGGVVVYDSARLVHSLLPFGLVDTVHLPIYRTVPGCPACCRILQMFIDCQHAARMRPQKARRTSVQRHEVQPGLFKTAKEMHPWPDCYPSFSSLRDGF